MYTASLGFFLSVALKRFSYQSLRVFICLLGERFFLRLFLRLVVFKAHLNWNPSSYVIQFRLTFRSVLFGNNTFSRSLIAYHQKNNNYFYCFFVAVYTSNLGKTLFKTFWVFYSAGLLKEGFLLICCFKTLFIPILRCWWRCSFKVSSHLLV